MKQVFKPSLENVIIKLLWLFFPTGLLVSIYIAGLSPDNIRLLIGVSCFVFGFCSSRVISKHCPLIVIDTDRLIVKTDWPAQQKEYLQHLIQNPTVHDQIAKGLLLNRALCFDYLESGSVDIDLSLYSDEERIRLIDALRMFLPKLIVIDTI